MDYISTKEAAEKWGIGERRVQFLCSNEMIQGARSIGKQWIIPSNAEKPIDGRSRVARSKKEFEQYHFPVLIHSNYFYLTSVLSEDELLLLKAQKLYLEGKYYESIKICRNLIDSTLSTSVKFGSYSTLAFCSMMTGLFFEFENSISRLSKMVKEESLHFEDYKLILSSITHHISRDPQELFEIDPNKLSTDAFEYYYSILLEVSAVSHIAETKNSLMIFEGICREADSNNILPTALLFHSILASLYERQNLSEKSEIHIKRACEIAIENKWLNYMSKFYGAIRSRVDLYLEKTSPKSIEEIQNLCSKNYSAWKVMAKVKMGEMPFNNIGLDYYELLILLAIVLSDAEMAKILGLTKKQVEEKEKEACSITGIKTREELSKYSKLGLITNID